jgi:hypothetical protein
MIAFIYVILSLHLWGIFKKYVPTYRCLSYCQSVLHVQNTNNTCCTVKPVVPCSILGFIRRQKQMHPVLQTPVPLPIYVENIK